MAIHGKAFAHCFDCDSPQQPLSSCGCISPTVLCSCKFLISLVDTSKELQGYFNGISMVLQWYFKSTSKEGQPDLLYLENAVIGENAPSMSLVSVFPVIGNM